MAAKKPASAIQSRLFWLASVVFFISGATGLGYQVVWFKRFTHVWGSSSLAPIILPTLLSEGRAG